MRPVLLDVLLGEAEVDEVEPLRPGARAHQKVVGLDIAMQELPLMHKLNPLDHLDGDLEHALQVHPPAALVEDILEGGSQQIHHQHVHVALGAAVVGSRDAVVDFVVAVEEVYQLGLVEQLRVLGRHRLAFHGHLRVSLQVQREEDLAEGAGAQFLFN